MRKPDPRPEKATIYPLRARAYVGVGAVQPSSPGEADGRMLRLHGLQQARGHGSPAAAIRRSRFSIARRLPVIIRWGNGGQGRGFATGTHAPHGRFGGELSTARLHHALARNRPQSFGRTGSDQSDARSGQAAVAFLSTARAAVAKLAKETIKYRCPLLPK